MGINGYPEVYQLNLIVSNFSSFYHNLFIDVFLQSRKVAMDINEYYEVHHTENHFNNKKQWA